MRAKWSFRNLLLPGIGLVLIVVGIVLINDHATIQYPLGTWRMDLDDALVGVGTILLGTAAIWTVWLKASGNERRMELLERQFNGGLSSLAAQILLDEMKLSGLEVGLAVRVAEVETRLDEVRNERDDCMTRMAVQDQLIDSIHRRLDENGLGRRDGD